MPELISDRNILDKFVIDFTKVLQKYSKYAIVSGFLAISNGRVRGTEDIDLIVEEMTEDIFKKFFIDIYKHKFTCIQGDDCELIWELYLKSKDTIRFVRKGTMIPDMEFKFPKTEADRVALITRKKLPLTGLPVYFGSIESTIAFKEQLLKSSKDIDDANHLRKIYSKEIDEKEINRIKKLIDRDILTKAGKFKSPDLVYYYRRDKTHDEFIEKWANYVKSQPRKVWKKQLNQFIDAQYQKSKEFYKRLNKKKKELF
ncbi:MAG: hypothetical protein WCX82_02170 [archaeon]|jgi:hypothetical protein